MKAKRHTVVIITCYIITNSMFDIKMETLFNLIQHISKCFLRPPEISVLVLYMWIIYKALLWKHFCLIKYLIEINAFENILPPTWSIGRSVQQIRAT